jgi:hypothetical protein
MPRFVNVPNSNKRDQSSDREHHLAIKGDGQMLDFHLLSIIGIGLIGAAVALKIARRLYCRAAMDANAQKIMGFDEKRADNT